MNADGLVGSTIDHRSPAVSDAQALIPYWAYLDLGPLAMSMRMRQARAIRRQEAPPSGRVRNEDATPRAPDVVARAGDGGRLVRRAPVREGLRPVERGDAADEY